jgi:branched-chain amino acid transport system substrate-binding protein
VNAHAAVVQWQKGEDDVYRTRSVFPENEAGAEFQLTKDLEEMAKK